MSEFLTKLLAYYNLTKEEYETLTAPVSVNDIPYAYAFFNFETFIARIEKAIANDEVILIYGDYDADGILATSILKYAFNKRGKDVFTMIPSRYKDGYGLSVAVVKRLAKRGIDLIITVDNGINAHEAIKAANELGIDVLVSDHHEQSATLPPAVALLHPELSSLPPLNSCGAYMALVISYGLLTYYDDYLISLASIATVADMMALVDRNRTVVKLGLALMNKHQYPSLVKLNGSTLFTDKNMGMRIAPRINALGRLSQKYEANILVEYFTTTDPKRINEIAHYVEEVYEARKKVSRARDLTNEELQEPAVCMISDELEGVLGLLAQSYLTNYGKPAIIFTESSEDPTLLKGSARSSKGLNVIDAFAYLKDYIIVSGGHAEAGGLTIKADDFLAFRDKFNEFATKNPLLPVEKQVITIELTDLTPENFAYVKALTPFGFSFEEPEFYLCEAQALNLTFSRDKKHIITTLENGIKVIGFNVSDVLKEKDNFAFYGVFSQSEFRGRLTDDFIIKDII